MQTRISEILSNLSPQTIAIINGEWFTDKALALGAESAFFSIKDIDGAGGLAGTKIDVKSLLPVRLEFDEHMAVMGNCIVVGGLTYGDRSDSPLEDEGNGKVCHRSSRRGSNEEHEDYLHAIGLSSSGKKNLQDETVSDILAARIIEAIRQDRSLMTTLSNLLRASGKKGTWENVTKTISDAIHQEGWEYALDYIAEWFLGVNWYVDLADDWQEKLSLLSDLLRESAAESAWEKAVDSGLLGNPLACMLDIYEHGGIAYSLSGHGMQDGWDTSCSGAVWIPDAAAEDYIREHVLSALEMGDGKIRATGSPDYHGKRFYQFSVDGGVTWQGDQIWQLAVESLLKALGRESDIASLPALMGKKAREYAKPVIEEFTDWVNGSIFNAHVFLIDRTTGELVETLFEEWSIIGRDNSESELDSMMMGGLLQNLPVTH